MKKGRSRAPESETGCPRISIKTCRCIVISVQCFLSVGLYAQTVKADSLRALLPKADRAETAYSIQNALVDFYIETKRDSALYFANNCIALAEKNRKFLDMAVSLADKGHALMHLQRLTEAFSCFNQALEIAGTAKNNGRSWSPAATIDPDIFRLKALSGIYHDYGTMIGEAGNQEARLQHYREALKIASQTGDSVAITTVLLDLGDMYIYNLSKVDSALLMEQAVIRVFSANRIFRPLGYANMLVGRIFEQKNNDSLALNHYYKAIAISTGFQNYTNLQGTYWSLSQFYLSRRINTDSALYYIRKTAGIIAASGGSDYSTVYADFVRVFQLKGNTDSILKFQTLALSAQQSAYNRRIETLNKLQQLALAEQEKLSNLQQREVELRERFTLSIILFILVAACIIMIILYRSNRKQRKANMAIHKAFAELKSAQAQLLQSEKMASLGQLTAGIAHEIQNPLNFVNNFSDLNRELVGDLVGEMDKGDLNEAKAIAMAIRNNDEKISHHGKRAEAIVKSMLLHTHSGTGSKQPVDLNRLANEYFQLAYHSYQAKDESFSVQFKTDFDDSIGKIDLVAQDIGRLLVNLYNNALYAVHENLRRNGESYDPTIIVSTRRSADNTIITVSDNGTGIPDELREKVFQPFFTTKPAGSGIGLGLSLSFDIVKAYGGEIHLETRQGGGTVFTVSLPDRV